MVKGIPKINTSSCWVFNQIALRYRVVARPVIAASSFYRLRETLYYLSFEGNEGESGNEETPQESAHLVWTDSQSQSQYQLLYQLWQMSQEGITNGNLKVMYFKVWQRRLVDVQSWDGLKRKAKRLLYKTTRGWYLERKKQTNPFVCWFIRYNLWETVDLAWVCARGPTELASCSLVQKQLWMSRELLRL